MLLGTSRLFPGERPVSWAALMGTEASQLKYSSPAWHCLWLAGSSWQDSVVLGAQRQEGNRGTACPVPAIRDQLLTCPPPSGPRGSCPPALLLFELLLPAAGQLPLPGRGHRAAPRRPLFQLLRPGRPWPRPHCLPSQTGPFFTFCCVCSFHLLILILYTAVNTLFGFVYDTDLLLLKPLQVPKWNWGLADTFSSLLDPVPRERGRGDGREKLPQGWSCLGASPASTV